ncbi:MAG: hypothetical protein H6839_13520 [Planctomycetes bacterium]|nr:hypothetical protein [Planctomycetota bacterium]
MKHTLPALALFFALLVSACPADNPPANVPGGKAAGMVIGSTFDGAPLTIGKGELDGKAVVITYFATW